MHLFVIIPTKKTIKWLKNNKLNKNAIQYALSFLFNDIYPTKSIKKTCITLQVDYARDSSTYIFGTNKIYICSNPYFKNESFKQRKFIIFLHFLHEFRHWMQSRILGIKDNQLKYTDKDMEENNKKYRLDKFEIDARGFEKKYVRRFMRYYTEYITSYL